MKASRHSNCFRELTIVLKGWGLIDGKIVAMTEYKSVHSTANITVLQKAH